MYFRLETSDSAKKCFPSTESYRTEKNKQKNIGMIYSIIQLHFYFNLNFLTAATTVIA